MAFKSGGGFVIRPVVTADSQGGANALISDVQSQLSSAITGLTNRIVTLEGYALPATASFSPLVKLTDLTFDLTITFSKGIVKVLDATDFTLTNCTISNFRRTSSTQTVVRLSATSPSSFSYKLNDDGARTFTGTSVVTKTADQVNVGSFSINMDDAGGIVYGIGNPLIIGLRKKRNPTANDVFSSDAVPLSDPPPTGIFLGGVGPLYGNLSVNGVVLNNNLLKRIDFYMPVFPINVAITQTSPYWKIYQFNTRTDDLSLYPDVIPLESISVPFLQGAWGYGGGYDGNSGSGGSNSIYAASIWTMVY